MTAQKHIIVKERTSRWVEDIVIGLNLCPFATGVWQQTRICVSNAQDVEHLLMDLGNELEALLSESVDTLATTLLVVPDWLNAFPDYLDALMVIEQCLEDIGLAEEFQVASFHPQYQFADQAADDPAHWTNRSPWPVFHILRAASVAEAVATYPDADGIPERNVECFRSMGLDAVEERLARIHGTAGTPQKSGNTPGKPSA